MLRRVGVGAGREPDVVGELGLAREQLAAVDHPRVAVPHRARAQRGQIGARLRAQNARAERVALGWLRATDLTASRAAFALTGDLMACAKLIAAEPAGPHTLPPTERVTDLVWSSVTEDLFAVRKHLGLLA